METWLRYEKYTTCDTHLRTYYKCTSTRLKATYYQKMLLLNILHVLQQLKESNLLLLTLITNTTASSYSIVYSIYIPFALYVI